MVRAWVVAVVAILVVGGLGVLVYARRTQSAVADLPQAARPVAADPAPPPPKVTQTSEYLGVVVAEQAVDVAANLEGRLADVLVRMGERVERGAPVATLDLRTLQSDLAVARAEVKGANAAEAQARLQVADTQSRLERSAKLGTLIPAADIDAARHEQRLAVSRLESARAGVTEAIARVTKLEVSRTDSSVRAPFAGRVAARYLDPGALVHSQSPIVRLISDSVRVRFAVPEEEARLLGQGTSVQVRLPTLGLSLNGVVETLAPEVDPAARMIFAEARLEPGADNVNPPTGVIARVTLVAPR